MGFHGFWALLKDTLGGADRLVLGEPPAGLGAEGSGGGSSQRARVWQGAQGKVHLTQEAEVQATAGSRSGTEELRAGDPVGPEEIPELTSLTATGPGIVVETQELNGFHITHCLARQLSQWVVEKEEHGKTTQVAEGAAVDLTNTIVVQEQAVQVDQATKHILRQRADTVAMQEELAEIDKISEQVILEEVELVLLQIEVLQAVEIVEDVMREGS